MGSVVVPRVPLGSQGFEVSTQGLGCMGMSSGYGPAKPEGDMIELITFAVEHGITFLDTADVYGPHTNEILVGKAIRGRRNAVQIATKFGICKDKDGKRIIRGDPDYVRSACEASLQRLDVDCIDLYYQHRVDNNVPIEITVGEMKKLVEEGKVKYLGLSEASASDIRRAHAVHPITAVQVEYSLWTRDVEDDIIPTCRELGIGIVPYSPLGRGFFAGFKSPEGHGNESDMRTTHPRFQGDSLAQNKRLRDRVQRIADTRKCSLNQLALAWMHHKGCDLVPIPGTTKRTNLESNMGALAVLLTKEEIEAIEEAVPADMVSGECTHNLKQTWRYNHSPPLTST